MAALSLRNEVERHHWLQCWWNELASQGCEGADMAAQWRAMESLTASQLAAKGHTPKRYPFSWFDRCMRFPALAGCAR